MTGTALVDLDTGGLRDAIGRHPVRLRHGLSGRPELTRAAFARVAANHPHDLIEHHRADLPLLLPSGETEALPLPPSEIVDGIDDNGCWMVLWAIDRVAPYATLVDEWVAHVRAAVPSSEGGLGPTESLALLGSPGAVVPAHVDNNHNVLFQLEGTKELFVGEFTDASEGQRQVERRYGPGALNLDRLPDVVTRYELGPGDAIYLPPYTCHWVVGGPEASVALSCNFRTAASTRAQQVHACNARLRRFGVTPRPPGASPDRDRAKVRALHVWLALRRRSAAALGRVRQRATRARSGSA